MGFKARATTGGNEWTGFGPELFGFLIELSINNDREWFQDNKSFYEEAVKGPLLSFIGAFAPHFAKVSPHFRADARSMFRIYRDVRFSRDKRPYKTHAAAHFRHVAGKDVHAPGFYLHIEPGRVFVGGGMWKPAPEALAKIRHHLANEPAEWSKVVDSRTFRAHCSLQGESLKRPPRGFDPDHPLIDSIKRKDFLALVELDDSDILSPDAPARVAEACRLVAPLNRWLCRAVGVPF